jgi:hypothetical protein
MLEKAVNADRHPHSAGEATEIVPAEKPQSVEMACQTNPSPSLRSVEQQTPQVRLTSTSTQVIKEYRDEVTSTDTFVCTTCIDKEESEEEESREVTPASSDESLYFLVQKEKEKYKALLQRTAEEKKRKRQEVAQLRQELDVIKSVLKMAGLHFDYKEYLDAQQRTKTPITVIKNADLRPKQPALPPIQRKGGEDAADQSIQDIHKDATVVYQHSEKLHDYSDLISELTAVPPRELPQHPARTRPMRPYSADFIDQIPAILVHNQNLDYNNRVHMHLDNVVYKLDNPIVTELPPVIEKKIFQKSAVAAPELKKKTNYANRIWRAKIVKEKHLRDLNDKAL